MTTYDFVHLTLLALGGVKGKTKLQKVIFFLGIATGHEKDLGYRAHFYGPYSDEVANSVERLKALGFLDQTISGGGTVDPRGFEVARHDYHLNASGKLVGGEKARRLAGEWDKIRKFIVILKPLIDLDYMRLSLAAKTWFLLQEKKGTGISSMDDLAELAPRFGWDVTIKQVQEAAKLLQQVKLAEISKN
jgi:hypothetical protein